MLDTSKWPTIELDVLKEVHLDPKNVRLEMAEAKVEADIIEDLFVNENALGLVESICKIGYLTNDTPVVLKRRGKYVMVEGNRRLAALKAIQNPLLVPSFQSRISAQASLLADRSAISKVTAMVAPNQIEADQLIAAIHTGNLRKPWSPSRQAAFFQAQIDSGRTFNDLLVRYPTINVRKFVFRSHIVNLFKSVEYDDAELQDFLKTKTWAKGLSTLTRIYESKEFLTLTGLNMDANGNISKTISDATFKEVASAIVRGMFEGNINTRSLNSVRSPRFAQLMKELRQIEADADYFAPSIENSDATAGSSGASPKPTTTGSPSSPDATTTTRGASKPSGSTRTANGSTTAPVSKPTTKKGVAAERKKKSRNLDLSQIKAPDSYPQAIKSLLGELSEIDVQKFPNGTFLMTRAILEKSIKAFAEAKSIDIKTTGNNQSGRVQLRHALDWLLDYVKTSGPTYLIQIVENVRTGKLVVYTNSGDSLNAINHNHHFMVDTDQVFSMWASIDSLMRHLMKP